VEGSDWAPLGNGDDIQPPEPGEQMSLGAVESRSGAGDSDDGRGWVRTSDLSRVRHAPKGPKSTRKPAFPSGMKHLPPPIL